MSVLLHALIPAAGRGTRVKEITNDGAKELLEVDGLPVIDWVIEEALQSGCTEIGVIVHREKKILINHLQNEWADTVSLLEQSSPDGLGDALLAGRSFVGESNFAVLLPDDLVYGGDSAIGQLIVCHRETGMSVVGVVGSDESTHPMFSDCGRVSLEPLESIGDHAYRASFKGGEEVRPIIGRYVLPAAAFDILSEVKGTQDGELREGVVLRTLARQNQLAGYSPSGTCLTVGVPEGYQFAERQIDSSA